MNVPVGSLEYAAPELLRTDVSDGMTEEYYTAQCDMWSIGVSTIVTC